MTAPRSLRISDPANPFLVRIGNPTLRKVSAARRRLGEDAGAWPPEIFDLLVNEHPWVSKLTVRTVLDNIQDATAVGYFHLTPFQVPATMVAAGEVPSITIPIIVRESSCAPFQVFAYGDKFYPVTEERVMRLLRINAPSMEVTRRDLRALTPYSDRNSPWRGGPSDGFGKMSAAALRSPPPPLRQKLSQAVTSGADTSVLKYSAVALATQTRRAHSGELEVRTYWSSHPETGRAGFSPWEKTSARALALKIGAGDLARLAEPGSELILPLGAAAPWAPKAVKESFCGGGRAELPSRSSLPTASVPCALFREDGSTWVATPVFPFSADIPVLDGASPAASDCLWMGPEQPSVRSLGEHGYVVTAVPSPTACAPVDIAAAMTAELNRGRSPSPYEASAPPRAVLLINRANDFASQRWEYVEVLGTPFQVEGTTMYRSQDSWRPETFRLDPGITTCLQGVIAGGRVTYLPAAMTKVVTVAYSGDLGPLPWVPPPVSELPDLPMTEPPTGTIRVSHARGTYRLESSTSPPPELPESSLSETEARLGLAARGLSAPAVDALIKASSTTGAAEAKFPLADLPVFHLGSLAWQRMQQDAVLKLSAADLHTIRGLQAAGRGCAQELQTLRQYAEDMTKESLAATGEVVDVALGLGVLSKETLHKYCAMVPDLDTALCQICALLVASQLGLEEIDEDACSAAIRSMDTILHGLRTLNYALTFTPRE